MKRSFCNGASLLLILATALAAHTASAHFPWLALDDQNRALLFFSENPAERDYHLPEAVLKAKVTQQLPGKSATAVKMTETEEDNFVGLRSAEPVAPAAALNTVLQYGNYHGTLLTYYAKHAGKLTADSPSPAVSKDAASKDKAAKLPQLDAVPSLSEKGVCLTILWEGKPLAGADVTLMLDDAEPQQAASDEDGEAWFPPLSTDAQGTIAAIIGHKVDAQGEIDGEPYTSVSHYATLTFMNDSPKANASSANATSALPALPEAIASFGAAAADGWLYVYSGHTGEAHAHSRDNLSAGFHRLNLQDADQWETLPCEQPLQGLAVVAHRGKIYRVGGLDARNASGEEDSLHSVADFAVYDPSAKTWTALPSLPAARSSHDAVVIGDKLYIVGGWQLSGDDDGVWQDEVLAYDLSQPSAKWQAVTKLPLNRRALAAGQFQGQLVVLGGMDDQQSISRRVDAFDPSTGEWTELADFPGEGMDGFGLSAWNTAGKLYASGTEGVLYQLSDDGQKWSPVAQLERPRFFHRLMSGKPGSLLVIAGSSLQDGHLADIERISLKPQK